MQDPINANLSKPAFDQLPFELEHQAFEQWLSQISTDDEILALQNLQAVLTIMSTSSMPAQFRYDCLKQFLKLDRQLSVALQSSLQNSNFPFSEKNTEIIKLSAGFAIEAANNFLILCKNKDFKGNDLFSKKDKAQIVYHAIDYKTRLFLNLSMLYRNVNKGYWHSCFMLYLFAKQNDVLTAEINEQKDSFISAFKHLLIFELCNTQQFNTIEILDIFYLLKKLAHKVTLLNSNPEKKFQGLPVINLRIDSAPYLPSENTNQQDIYLYFISSLELIKYLHQLVNENRSNFNLSKNVLLRLIKTLTLNQHRRSAREPAKGSLKMIVGFDNIKSYLQKEKEPDPSQNETKTFELDQIGLTLADVDYQADFNRLKSDRDAHNIISGSSDEFSTMEYIDNKDIWNTQPTKSNSKPKDKTEGIYTMNAQLYDKSMSGFRLSLKKPKMETRVGEIIGILLKNSLLITVIRRILQVQENETHLGIEILGTEAKLLTILHTGNIDSTQALLIKGKSEKLCFIIREHDFDNEAFIFSTEDEKISKYRVEKNLHSFSEFKLLEVTLN